MGGSQGLQSRAAGTSLRLLHVFLDSFNKHSSGLCARSSSTHFTDITLVNPHTRLLTRQCQEPHFQGRRLSPERLSNLSKALQPVSAAIMVHISSSSSIRAGTVSILFTSIYPRLNVVP